MYRTTTPTIALNIKNKDFDLNLISTCHVTLQSENGGIKHIYDSPDIDAENHQIKISLSQEETAEYRAGFVLIQIKCKLQDDQVVASNIIKVRVNDVLEEEFL